MKLVERAPCLRQDIVDPGIFETRVDGSCQIVGLQSRQCDVGVDETPQAFDTGDADTALAPAPICDPSERSDSSFRA